MNMKNFREGMKVIDSKGYTDNERFEAMDELHESCVRQGVVEELEKIKKEDTILRRLREQYVNYTEIILSSSLDYRIKELRK